MTGEGGVWECKGIEGFDVLYLEGDLARLCCFWPGGAQPMHVRRKLLAPSIRPAPKLSGAWKTASQSPRYLRWFTDNGSGEENAKQNWLVVTKLNGKDACRTALIDTKYPNANAVARAKADGNSHTLQLRKGCAGSGFPARPQGR